jgi:predicted kinase
MDPPGHRSVGWSILRSLARAQLRRGDPAVLDGVARAPEIAQCRELVDEEGVRFLVVVTECDDADVHRSRVEGRQRSIPDWYELDWADVQRARDEWAPIGGIDLVLDATKPLDANLDRLHALLDQTIGP